VGRLPFFNLLGMSKVVLITGASSGLGLTTALYLHQQGFTVFGTSRNPQNYNQKYPFTFSLWKIQTHRASKTVLPQ